MPPIKVLFLCTGNSCRSQMAEGWTRHLKSGVIEPYSAGLEKHGMNPYARLVMGEAGADISAQYSKTLDELKGVAFDYVVTVCGHANEHCPHFPGPTKVVHVGFEDPPQLTKRLPDGEAKLAVYRRVRDEIRRFVEKLPEALENSEARTPMSSRIDSDSLRRKVREGYAQIAASRGSCCGPAPASCRPAPAASQELAEHLGYTADELAALPEGANMGLSCGNPNALAALQPGEVVLDLGAGGGFDLFIAGRKVGPSGRAIGVDMTPEMLLKARKNASTYREKSGLENVEFRLGEIEHLPVADSSVDVVISNCVINLSPDKPQVWREISRVLKPGGRVAVSDLGLLQPLPPAITEMVEALIGCVAGAVLVSETERMARDAGLVNVVAKAKPSYIDGMVDGQDPLYQKIIAHLPAGTKPRDYITSLEITARKGTAPEPSTLEVYDPALCCSTGVCGPEVDPKLVQFAADLKWLREQGVEVRRFNLSQNPAAFVENDLVKQALTERADAALPIVIAGHAVLASGYYPNRAELTEGLGLRRCRAEDLAGTPAKCCG